MIDGQAERTAIGEFKEAAATAAKAPDFRALLDVLAALEAEFGPVLRQRAAHAE